MVQRRCCPQHHQKTTKRIIHLSITFKKRRSFGRLFLCQFGPYLKGRAFCLYLFSLTSKCQTKKKDTASSELIGALRRVYISELRFMILELGDLKIWKLECLFKGFLTAKLQRCAQSPEMSSEFYLVSWLLILKSF